MPTQRPNVRISFHPEEIEAAEHPRAARRATHIAPGGKLLFAAIGLALLAIASSLPATNGEFLLNDDVNVSANLALRSWRGLTPIWVTPQRMPQIQPFTYTALLIEYRFFHDSPFGYHVVNLLLHACVTMLLWTLLRKLELRGAWLAAALFAVHPVTVASVAWISQQKVLWASIWYLLSLIIYFRFCGLNPRPPDDPEMASYYQFGLPRSRWLLYLLAMVALALSLCSQAALAVTFVPVVLIAVWWERARITRKDLVPLILPTALSAAFAVAVAYVEIYHAGARGGGFPTLIQRIPLVGLSMFSLALSTFVPLRLAFAYGHLRRSTWVLSGWIGLVLIVAALVCLWRFRSRTGRSPLAAVAAYIAMLLPISGIVNFVWLRQSLTGDHLQYLACAIPIAAIVCALADVRAARAHLDSFRIGGPSVATVAVILLLVASFTRAMQYKDPRELWSRTLEVNPRSIAAHNSLGRLALEENDRTTAQREFRLALDIDPTDIESLRNLASVYCVPGEWDRAVGLYYQILYRYPDDAEARFSLAHALAEQNDIDGAIREYREVIRRRPDHSTAYMNLAQIYSDKREEWDEAVKLYREAVRLNPRLAQAHVGLALALFQMGKIDEAVDHNNIAREIDPRNFEAYFNGTAYLDYYATKIAKTPAEKYAYYARALEWSHAAINIREDSAMAFCRRGYILAKMSPFEPKDRAVQILSEAITCFRRAQALNPDTHTRQEAQAGEQLAQREKVFRESRADGAPIQPINRPPASGPTTR